MHLSGQLFARQHRRCLDRTARNAKAAAKTVSGIVFHLFVLEDTRAEGASFNAFAAIDADIRIQGCDIFRPGHYIRTLEQLHNLQIMAAT